MDPDRIRERMNSRQAKWMRERQIAQEREAAQAEMGYSSPSASTMAPMRTGTAATAALPGAPEGPASGRPPQPVGTGAGWSQAEYRPEQVIDRVTERMIDRLRLELKEELQKESATVEAQKAQEGAKLEGFLAQEIESHTCPICYELMVPPDHSPVIVFPCGHTFCNNCMVSYEKATRKQRCPYCREDIKSKAPNLSLQQLIANYMQKRDRTRVGAAVGPLPSAEVPDGPAAAPAGAVTDEAERVQQEYATKSMRYRVLQNELQDTQEEAQQLDTRLVAGSSVLSHLQSEEKAVILRIQAAQKELALVQNEITEQSKKVEALQKARADADENIHLIQQTLDPLAGELEKLQLLMVGVREMHH